MTASDWRDKVFWVIGLARSGCAAGALLRRQGSRVIGIDDADEAAVRRRWGIDGLSDLAPQAFDEIHTGGGWPSPTPEGVILSPGVPPGHPGLRHLPPACEIIGELELGARFCQARQVAITGTNGKSTTTELIAHMLNTGGLRAEALGNLGRPLCLVADQLDPTAVAVLEVSSFQLETVRKFAPETGLVLNLAPDHLDRYPDLAGYYAAKQVLAELIPAGGTFITWTGCAEACAWPTRCRKVLFGDKAVGAEVFYQGDGLWTGGPAGTRLLLAVGQLALQSPPNLLNALAAVAAGRSLGLDSEALKQGLQTFKGLQHRHELVGRRGDVCFINDSKATNVHAVCGGLKDYPGEVVLIVGGSGKGEDYRPLREVMGVVRHVVLLGEEGPAIGEALAGEVPTSRADSMEAAVALAANLAEPDAVVLLSPACASFDMFANYGQRGRAFAAAAAKAGAS